MLTQGKNGPCDLCPHVLRVRQLARAGTMTHKWKIFDLHLNEAVSPQQVHRLSVFNQANYIPDKYRRERAPWIHFQGDIPPNIKRYIKT